MNVIEDMKQDFKKYMWFIWKYLGLPKPTPIQLAIADDLQNIDDNLILLAFRGVGKSWITSTFVTWLLWKDQQLETLVVSASANRAIEFATFTKRLFKEIPLLQPIAPDRKKGLRDSVLSFDVYGKKPSHAPSVKAAGITSQITGSRADVIIADDVEIPNNSFSAEARAKLLKAVHEFTNILKPNGRIIFLGTPQTEESIYQKLMKTGSFVVRLYPAKYPTDPSVYGNNLADFIKDQLQKDPDLAGHSTEPTRFPDEELERRLRTIGHKDFALQYMLDMSLSDLDMYPLKLKDLIVTYLEIDQAPLEVTWTSAYDKHISDIESLGFENDGLYWAGMVSDKKTNYEFKIMAIDPSGKGKDETAYAIVAFSAGKLFLLDWGGFKEGYEPSVLKALAKKAKEYKVTYILIEENFGQGMFEKLLNPFLMDFKVKATIETIRSTTKKEERIINILEPLLLQHKLVVNYTPLFEEFSKVKTGQLDFKYSLQYQLTHISHSKATLAHDDRLDALAMACSKAVDRLGLSEEAERERIYERWLEEEIRKMDEAIDGRRKDRDVRNSFIRFWR